MSACVSQSTIHSDLLSETTKSKPQTHLRPRSHSGAETKGAGAPARKSVQQASPPAAPADLRHTNLAHRYSCITYRSPYTFARPLQEQAASRPTTHAGPRSHAELSNLASAAHGEATASCVAADWRSGGGARETKRERMLCLYSERADAVSTAKDTSKTHAR